MGKQNGRYPDGKNSISGGDIMNLMALAVPPVIGKPVKPDLTCCPELL